MLLSRAITIAKHKLHNNQKYLTHYFAHILKINEVDILTQAKSIHLQSKHKKRLFKFISLSNKNFPYAYIVKNMPFLDYNFYVNANCLIPREDSASIIELLDEYLLNNNLSSSRLTILELGVGSGCLILSILQKYFNLKAFAIDIKSNTLKVARKNAKRMNVLNRITFMLGDMFKPLPYNKNNQEMQKFDIIISNPPYIDFNDDKIAFDVKKYEPKVALFAKHNGLYFYQEIFQNASLYLNTNGIIIVEIGINQDSDVIKIANNYGYKLLATKKDSANINRSLLFKR
jgi:release factor glutamine methyltransferase